MCHIYSKTHYLIHLFFPNETKRNSLLYADDLIILSRSKIGLQHCLNTFHSYCETWMLKINPKKTKIMIFQKRPRKFIDNNFKIGNEHVEIVQRYTHLGTRLTYTRDLTLALKHLKEKASSVYGNIPSLIDFIPKPLPRFLTQCFRF